MTTWATHGAIVLAAAAALVGCGTPATTALQARSTHTSARVVAHKTSKTSRVAAQTAASAGEAVKITTSYYPALRAADQFLNDWLTYNGKAGLTLLTSHAKQFVPQADVHGKTNKALQYFANPQPTHQAFEIAIYREISANELQFRVWMYAYAMGVQSFPISRPPGQVLTVMKHGMRWMIDNLPRY